MVYGLPVELDGLSYDQRVAAKMILPQRKAEKRFVVVARLVLIECKSSAELRLNAKNLEQCCRAGGSGNLYWLRVPAG